MDKKIRLGLIGCGLRGTGYIGNLQRFNINFELVAVADNCPDNLKNANKYFAAGKAEMFDSGEKLLQNTDIDAVIIATPNVCHRSDAVETIKKGITFLMEKPVATTIEDLKAIWDASKNFKAKVAIGFTLRYAPFYQEIKKVVEKGTLGQILTINAEELMSDRLSMIFCRSKWRKNLGLTGGLLLEKCCHDIDIINWISNSSPEKVSSFSNQSFLTPNKDIERFCNDCSNRDNCRFEKNHILKSFLSNTTETKTKSLELYDLLIDNRCPYYHGSAYPDHQSAIIKYENGILCTFNVMQVQPANRRTIHILGTEGRLYGVADDNFFTIFHRTGPNDERKEVVKVYPEKYGHNGGDGPLTMDFLNLINSMPNQSRPGLREGIESALVCIEADKSAKTGQSIDLKTTRQTIFGK